MRQDWSRSEVEKAVDDYLDMLAKELRREHFNKAARNRILQETLTGRSPGSIEFKHQNISAILIELGYPYVEGYKPRSNYQDLLREVVTARVAADRELASLIETVVERDVTTAPSVEDILAIRAEPPVREHRSAVAAEDRPYPATRQSTTTNYLEREARNRSLGRAGEELVLRFEHERLWRAGQRILAERIEHVSVTKGDGLGYDIQSFENSGQPRLIEVKTTRFGAMTPFFASSNEVAVSKERGSEYSLYRVYDFQSSPRLFMLPGSLETTCELQPVQFRALAR